jgi:hypothetical protein
MYDLGIRRLFLLGCDFRMDADHAYHFEQRRGTSAIAGNRFTYKRLQERFTQLRAVFEAADFNVYNCNPRSKLTAFDFVSFDDAVSLTLDEFDHIDVTTERTAGMYDVEKPKFSPMVEAPAAKPMPTTRRTMGFDVTLLTPTGDRHHAFALCEQWMRRQTFRGRVQWVVVDDGGSPTTVTLQREGWQVTYIPRQKQADDPKHTLSVNMLAGLGHAQSGKIIMVEDDEWYHPTYVETMARWLDETELVGYGVDVYAHLCNLRWNQLPHERHASLNKTAFRASVIKAMTDVCQRRSPSIDHLIWRTFKGSKRVHMVNERRTPLSVGWKGMPGRSGLLPAHQAESRIWRGSRPFEDHLEAWLGEDAATYRAMSLDVGPSHPVVYTAIIGGYDQVQPVPVCPGWDYICFSDQRIEVPDPWRLRIIQRAMEDPTREARRLKLLAHRWFPRAPYTIWLDGHLRLTRSPSEVIDIMDGHRVDVMPMRHTDRDCVYQELAECLRLGKDKPDVMRAQVQRYRDEGYPEHAGMVETGCLVRRHTPAVAAFNEAWWDELSNWSRRDQLSFNYVARKLGLSFHAHGSDSDARLRRDYVEIVNPRHRKITDEQAVLA